MSNKKLGVILLAVSFLVIVGFVIFSLTNKEATAPAPGVDISLQQVTQQQTQNSQSNTANSLQGSVDLTLSEVQKHSSESDCWTIVSGKVYDITEYVPRHPGGDEILRACGADGTTLFTERKTSDGEVVGSGTSHGSSAQSQLDQFLLGTLQN